MYVLDVATKYLIHRGKTLLYAIGVVTKTNEKRSVLLLGELVYHENLMGRKAPPPERGLRNASNGEKLRRSTNIRNET